METRSQPGKVTHPPISGSGGQYQAEEPVLSPRAGIFGGAVSSWRPPSFQFKGHVPTGASTGGQVRPSVRRLSRRRPATNQ